MIGASEACEKHNLSMLLSFVCQVIPHFLPFTIKTWLVPSEWIDFRRHALEAKDPGLFIVKPTSGSGGKDFLDKEFKVLVKTMMQAGKDGDPDVGEGKAKGEDDEQEQDDFGNATEVGSWL